MLSKISFMNYSSLCSWTGLLAFLALLLCPPAREMAVGQTPGRPPTSVATHADCAAAQGLAQVVCLAEAFKATLTPSQRATVQRPYSKADAVRWSNFPQQFSRPQRVGISLGALTATQLAAAKALLAAVLAQGEANEGFDELEGGLAADNYLGKATGKTDTFGAGHFYLALLGTPSLTGLWELQYGGHHYAFANTYTGGQTTGVTPTFRGAEPMIPIPANGRTYQPLAQENQAFARLLGSLSSPERAAALLPTTFHDVLLGPGQDGQFPAARQGLRVGSLSAAQQQVVLQALKLYVNDLSPATAAAVLATYQTQLADTYVAYAGSGTMQQASDYVRLDGPRLWLEYSVQASRDFPGTVHPHSVWRDRVSDYGGN